MHTPTNCRERDLSGYDVGRMQTQNVEVFDPEGVSGDLEYSAVIHGGGDAGAKVQMNEESDHHPAPNTQSLA